MNIRCSIRTSPTRIMRFGTVLLLLVTFPSSTIGFAPATQLLRPRSLPSFPIRSPLHASDGNKNDDNDEAARLRSRAQDLREQIRDMEESLGDKRPRTYDLPKEPASTAVADDPGMSLRNKRVLVVGANGRLGAMVCRNLLRNHPQTEVVAAVHYVGENSPTSRGYGRLSYEVGAEDGVGTIGPAWNAEERTASFQYSDEMKEYNLQNLRVVEVELLDPVQCNTILEDVDSVVWCATDFNGNKPRAISGLNIAFLFRAVADPTKGRVEIEGLRNVLGGLKNAQQSQKWKANPALDAVLGNAADAKSKTNRPINFVMVSAAPDAYDDFETPFGTFNGLKREGEQLLKEEFPSLSHAILQMSRYDDNFVEESLDVILDEGKAEDTNRRRINRRDAARAAVDALTNEELVDQTVQVWTATR